MVQNKKQEERLDYLLHEFKKDSVKYKDVAVNDSYNDKRRLLRSLMNIRMPGRMEKNVMKVQDEFLAEEAHENGIITLTDILTVNQQYGSKNPYADKISVYQGDITMLAVDAIVNAANSQMLGCFVPCHGCIDNAIHSAAGIQLREECNCMMRIQGHEEETGTAKLTKGYNLPCKHIIHTVGPIIRGSLTERDCQLLRSCYRSCLEMADTNGLKSIAFCCVSTGEFHFPNEKAAEIAVDTVTEYLKNSGLERVIFNVFKDYDLILYEDILKGWASPYI
ncbi:hypothetical protein AXY43_15945 [Clostridium sp. MF28]|uniref:protein-ADP-ribose hydrolase n=1 Tax=Clostridium TaxID=1485 RepID=UPI000CF8F9F2|nr:MULTISPECIES: protein-ADP-ribose hydrolase [Clostridium]AVK49371.1 hypothetical protein AXY43_15945 [Clostridium sp. MF28]PSM58013.1 hypothetical protein C4L39_09365 [Clostridium diolis]